MSGGGEEGVPLGEVIDLTPQELRVLTGCRLPHFGRREES